jgi:UDP-N-acetylmuramyl tripeptide synthase
MLLEDVMLHIAPGRRPAGSSAHRRQEVRGLTPDVRRVSPGTVFVALPERHRADPLAAYAAVDRGARAVICEPDAVLPAGLARIEVPDCQRAFAQAAAAFFGNPEQRLQFFGVPTEAGSERETRRLSTNVTHLLAQLLSRPGQAAASFSELSCEAADRVLHRRVSEFDFFEFFEWLAQAVRRGQQQVVVELNRQWRHALEPELKFRIGPEVGLDELDCQGTWRGTVGRIEGVQVSSRLVGRENWRAVNQAWRAVQSAGMATELGRLPRLRPTPGFLEPVLAGQPFGVLVDAARTPAAVSDLLEDVRTFATGRLILVLGAPEALGEQGRRDLGCSASIADFTVVTSDDPGQSAVESLSAELADGLKAGAWTFESDRERALFRAISLARPGDVVLVTGKAHSLTEIRQSTVIPWDDRNLLSAALAARGYGGTRL